MNRVTRVFRRVFVSRRVAGIKEAKINLTLGLSKEVGERENKEEA